MGFNAGNLSRTTPYNVTGPATYQYFSLTDNVAAVSNAGYFRPFGGANNQGLIPFQFNVGDNIQCTCTNGSVLLNVTDINPITTSPETITVVVGPDSVNTAAIQDNAVTSAKIAVGTIVNADINAAAAIAFSKLAPLASGNILVGSVGTVPTSVAMSGDATIIASGALTIAANAITTAKILAANVTLAKLAAGITPSHVIKFAGQPTTVGGAAAEAFAVPGVLVTDLAFVQVVNDGTLSAVVIQAACTADTLTVTFVANPGNDAVINYQILRAAV